MSRAHYTSYSRRRRRESPATALGLLLVGLVALCLSVFYPVSAVLGQVSVDTLATGTLTLPWAVVVTTVGLVAVAVGATCLGFLLLFLRL